MRDWSQQEKVRLGEKVSETATKERATAALYLAEESAVQVETNTDRIGGRLPLQPRGPQIFRMLLPLLPREPPLRPLGSTLPLPPQGTRVFRTNLPLLGREPPLRQLELTLPGPPRFPDAPTAVGAPATGTGTQSATATAEAVQCLSAFTAVTEGARRR